MNAAVARFPADNALATALGDLRKRFQDKETDYRQAAHRAMIQRELVRLNVYLSAALQLS